MITDVLIYKFDGWCIPSTLPPQIINQNMSFISKLSGEKLATLDQTPLSDPISCCQGLGLQSKVGPEHHQHAQFCYNMKEIWGESRIIQETNFSPKERRMVKPLICCTLNGLILGWTSRG